MSGGRGLALIALALTRLSCGAPPFVLPPPSPERVYALSEVDERPEIVLTPPLHYPDDPRLTGVDGAVVVRLVVDTAGNPEPATVRVVAAPDSALGRAGDALVRKMLFRPARVRGRVVQVAIDIPVEFSHAALPPVTLHIAGDVYGENDVEEQPHPIAGPPVTYPASLLLARITGRVVVEAVIDTTGQVEEGSIRVIESTDPRFNEAAKSYVGGARFSAGRVAGRAVRVRFQIPVDFRLPSRH